MINAYILDRNNTEKLSRDIADFPEGIVMPVDKPYRWTSADAVRKVKFALQRHFQVRNIKVGHAGTLDPLATGILVICAGKATKIAETLQASEKEYIATFQFGSTTPSFDLEKEVDFTFPYEHITEELIVKTIPSFLGEQDQVPPIFSAKMINGKRAYMMARAGEEVPLKSARINISEMELMSFALTESGIPYVIIKIRCSKGTYIRSLARDLGLAVGSGAHLTALKRTASGDFLIKNAICLDELKLF